MDPVNRKVRVSTRAAEVVKELQTRCVVCFRTAVGGPNLKSSTGFLVSCWVARYSVSRGNIAIRSKHGLQSISGIHYAVFGRRAARMVCFWPCCV